MPYQQSITIALVFTVPSGTTPAQTVSIDLTSTPVNVSPSASTLPISPVDWKSATGVDFGSLVSSISRGVLTLTLPGTNTSGQQDQTFTGRVFF